VQQKREETMTTRRQVVAGMASLPLAGLGLGVIAARAQEAATQDEAATQNETAAADTLTTSEGELTIHPVEHASLVLQFGDDVLYFDPVGGAAPYEGLPPPSAILITHGHGDHFDVATLEAIAGTAPILTSQEVFDKLPEALQAQATAIGNGETADLLGYTVEAVPAYNITAERLQYHPKGVGNGYVVTFGDKRVYVAGDTEPVPEMLALTDIALAFLPMNLPYTMTVEQAAEAVNGFRPAIVYPYHYGDSDLSAFEAGVDDGVEVRIRNWYPNGQG
jgi:L-ascorbate metabolism protein UlaG (beta-lactamase superfamily)